MKHFLNIIASGGKSVEIATSAKTISGHFFQPWQQKIISTAVVESSLQQQKNNKKMSV